MFDRDPSASLRALVGRLPKPASSLQQDVYREQQLILVKHQLMMGGMNIFNGMLVAVGAAAKVPPLHAAIWFLPIFLIGAMQVLSWFKLRNLPPPDRVSGSYLRKAEFGAIVLGVIWGSASVFLAAEADAAHAMFIWMMQAGMAAGLTSILGPAPRITSRFVFACRFVYMSV